MTSLARAGALVAAEGYSNKHCPADGSAEQREMAGSDSRGAIGCLMYLTVCTRPDIAYAVERLICLRSLKLNSRYLRRGAPTKPPKLAIANGSYIGELYGGWRRRQPRLSWHL